jgi:hypothetical protein
MAETGYAKAIFYAGKRVWGLALLEISVVAGISLIPLVGAAFREALSMDGKVPLTEALAKAFLGGQLIFYSVGLIASIVWHSNKDFNSFFPLRTIFNLYCTIGLVLCSIIIGYDPTLTNINYNILARTSVCLFVMSIFIYILMTVITHVHVNVGKSLAETDSALSNAVQISRGLK